VGRAFNGVNPAWVWARLARKLCLLLRSTRQATNLHAAQVVEAHAVMNARRLNPDLTIDVAGLYFSL
jgi:hypothetical protein